MPSVSHEWVVRGRCPGCGQYFWTNPGSPSVQCQCTGSIITNDVLVAGDAVTDEAEFKQAVADDIGVPLADLDLIGPA